MGKGDVPADLQAKPEEEDESEVIFSDSGSLSTPVVTPKANTHWETSVAGHRGVKAPSQALTSFWSKAHERQEELYW